MSTLKRIFTGLTGVSGTIVEEMGEESLQSLFEGRIESAITGKDLMQTKAMQGFKLENFVEMAKSVGITVLAFYIAGLPLERSNYEYEKHAQALLNDIAEAYENNDVERMRSLGIESSAMAKKMMADVPAEDANNLQLLKGRVDAFTQKDDSESDTGISPDIQMGDEIQGKIAENVHNNSEGIQAALTEGMTALTNIEKRIKADSGNVNYNGFNVDTSHTAYMDYNTAPGDATDGGEKAAKMLMAASAMLADMKAAVGTGSLSAAEVSRLHGIAADVVGDTKMAAKAIGIEIRVIESGSMVNRNVAKEDLDNGDGAGDNKQTGKGGESGTESKITEPTLIKGGKPKGKYATPDPNDSRPINRQNESADLLANEGYDIEMLPDKKGGSGYGIDPGSNPDYKIEGEVFDCYAPDSLNVRNIWSTVANKTSTQAERILLNLDDYLGSVDKLYEQFMEYDIATLKELLIIKDGKITRWIP